jgi:hypothetical protein
MVVQFHLLEIHQGNRFRRHAGPRDSHPGDRLVLAPPGQRTAKRFSTAVRNVGVSLVIATASFPGTPAVIAGLSYAPFRTILLAVFAVGWGRWAPTGGRQS